MGTALRLHFDEGGRRSGGGEPLVCLYRHASKLDRICKRLALKRLSEFHDRSASHRAPEGVSDTIKIMVKERPWFPVSDGRATFGPLLRWLEQNPARFGLLSDDYRDVLEELRSCVEGLEAAPRDAGGFNLGVVSS